MALWFSNRSKYLAAVLKNAIKRIIADGTRYEKVVLAVTNTTLQIAKNHPDIAGRAIKEIVHNNRRNMPRNHLPAKGFNIYVLINLFMTHLLPPI